MKLLKGFFAGCVSESLVNRDTTTSTTTSANTTNGSGEDSTEVVPMDPNIEARSGLGSKFGYIDGKRG